MRIGITYEFEWREDLEEEPSDVADKTDEVLAKFASDIDHDRWFGWITLVDDQELRQRVFDAFCAAVPKEFHPCREVLHFRDVTTSDLLVSDWTLASSFFPVLSEAELDTASMVRYDAVKVSCSSCRATALRADTTTFIGNPVLDRRNGAVQLPNSDAFCLHEFAGHLAQAGLSGLSVHPCDGNVSRVTIVPLAPSAGDVVCDACGAYALSGYEVGFDSEREFVSDFQAFRHGAGTGYVLSRKAVAFLDEELGAQWDCAMKGGAMVPLVRTPETKTRKS